MPSVRIGDRFVGDGAPCLVVAEVGVNHDGRLDRALELVDAAAAAGADVVKFQTFSAARVAGADAPKPGYQLETTSPDESQRELLHRLELDADAHRALQARCAELGVGFLSTPFDRGSADLLEKLGVDAYKIASGELTNAPFLEYVAAKGKPILLSTGAATEDEVGAALAVVAMTGNDQIVLLHCVSAYPAAAADANLRAIPKLAERFGLPVGWSDHISGNEVALAAVASGAAVVEKHLTLDRTLPGPDHAASLEPDELAELVRGIRIVESALGDGLKRPAPAEESVRAAARRSLVAARDLDEGTVLTDEMLDALRPGGGLPPTRLPELLGRRLARAVRSGEQLHESDLVA